MDDWRFLATPPARLRWARRHALFETAADAARALQIEAPTYRTYERETEDGGRWPKPAQLQRISKRFGVNWVWIEMGQGAPLIDPELADDMALVSDKVQRLPADKRRDAINAALGVLESYIRKAG